MSVVDGRAGELTPKPWPESVETATLLGTDAYRSLLFKAGHLVPDRRVFFPQLPGEGGVADPKWLKASDWKKEHNQNIAASLQHYLEDSMVNMVTRMIDELGGCSKNLCLSGGTTLNVVANAKVRNTRNSPSHPRLGMTARLQKANPDSHQT